MIWAFFTAVLLGLLGALAALVTGRWRFDPMAEPVRTTADPGLPDTVHAPDVDRVRFDTALRGYRIDQVDEVLDRLRDRIAEQDATIQALRTDEAPAPEPPHAEAGVTGESSDSDRATDEPAGPSER